jgi:hypothetical protein
MKEVVALNAIRRRNEKKELVEVKPGDPAFSVTNEEYDALKAEGAVALASEFVIPERKVAGRRGRKTEEVAVDAIVGSTTDDVIE